MLTLRIMGSQQRIEQILAPYPDLVPVGGHTDVLIDPKSKEGAARARALYTNLVTVAKGAAIDTSVPSAPRRLENDRDLLKATEVVFIPAIAGG